MQDDYTLNEILTVSVARRLRNGEMGFLGVGTGGRAFSLAVGIPLVAARLAQLTHAPDFAVQLGPLISPLLDQIPDRFTEDALLAWEADARLRADDNLDAFVNGKVDVGFVSGAQIDPFGNLNITSIGGYPQSKVRLVGCLALPEHQAFAQRTFILMDHGPRTFIPQVDFITGVGHRVRGKTRQELGLPGGGPSYVFSDLGVFNFNGSEGRMKVESLHPGVSRHDVEQQTGFEVEFPGDIQVTKLPNRDDIRFIREEIDPGNILLKY